LRAVICANWRLIITPKSGMIVDAGRLLVCSLNLNNSLTAFPMKR
jgi:hypothetical protein